VSFKLGNGGNFGLSYKRAEERFADAWLTANQGTAWVAGAWTKWLNAEVGGSVGTAPYYDEAAPRVGDLTTAWGGLTVRPVSRLALSTNLSCERMTEPEGALYEGVVARGKAEVFLDRTLWMRVIGDVSTFDGSRSAEGLVAWERSPGRALYAGGAMTGGDASTWSVFAKASWAWSR
jgi:hypothetical protein